MTGESFSVTDFLSFRGYKLAASSNVSSGSASGVVAQHIAQGQKSKLVSSSTILLLESKIGEKGNLVNSEH